eukprot:m.176373 g.176373  ORF g.176373 m.176373 type:complete len:579 (-) comp14152_c0_seq1:248-1984(-)
MSSKKAGKARAASGRTDPTSKKPRAEAEDRPKTGDGKRHSIQTLQREYENGNPKPLEDVMRAWVGIQSKPYDDPYSFFTIGGYHGEPFEYRRDVDALDDTDHYVYWGGYCNHGNVLFPTWHRVYVLWLERALQSVVPGVRQPFWDETEGWDKPSERDPAVPWAFTDEKFTFKTEDFILDDGTAVRVIPNPLRSFTLPHQLDDKIPSDELAYVKPKGYTTVRYPLSGLVGTKEAAEATKRHNAKYKAPSHQTKELRRNVHEWMIGGDPGPGAPPSRRSIYDEYRMALSAKTYTTFSNTTSMTQWNLDHPEAPVVALESPHNHIHLAVGGFDVPSQGDFDEIAGANGDMGENNTAALDPIFFFHHCFVDYVFWQWQLRHKDQDAVVAQLEIAEHYAGTTAWDSQGPTPGFAPGAALRMDTPLEPFAFDTTPRKFTSKDCVNIMAPQLGYEYGRGSLDIPDGPHDNVPLTPPPLGKHLQVYGINRAQFSGSFTFRVSATVLRDGRPTVVALGSHCVFSRRQVRRCANCLTHMDVVAFFPLDDLLTDEEIDYAKREETFRVMFQHRGPHGRDDLKYKWKVVS